MRFHLLLLVLSAAALGAARPSDSTPMVQDCKAGDPDTTIIAHLRVLAAKYHPEALAAREASGSQVIGLIVDEKCTVLRHGTMQRADDQLTIDSAMATMFPTAKMRPFVVGGIADIAPTPQTPGSAWLVWLMVKS